MTRIVLDTNVLMSGIFWSGPPAKILSAWHEQRLRLVISPDILSEYIRVSDILSKKYTGINILPLLDLITIRSELYEPVELAQSVSRDPDDEKFIALCMTANCQILVSGDSDLLDISGYKRIEVLKPADFVKRYL